MSRKEPLAYRMCPRTLDEFVGQDEIIGENKMLNRLIRSGNISSILLFGPPGSGKTTLAKIISNSVSIPFRSINAVTAGIADIKKVIEEARNPFFNKEGRTVLFIDEIHRFNKAQQDALLPSVEDGTVLLIGATTENPYFEVNKALISRSTVFMLKPLTESNIRAILRAALNDRERGLGNLKIDLAEDAIDFMATLSSGDARIALNALELAAVTTPPEVDGAIHIDLAVARECIQKKAASYDKNADGHYDTISAFIKSMRGSDPDAAVFYLARALYAGEDIEFLARRIVICAAEDVGLANPHALTVAVAAHQAAQMIGMPEARIILSEAVLYVATSPKSNACYTAINKALHDVESKNTGTIPLHLRNAPHSGLKEHEIGLGYKYPHDYPGNFVAQQYLPREMSGASYYSPGNNGMEKKIKEWIAAQKSGNT